MTYSAAAEALLLAPDHEPGSADRVASIVRRWHAGEHPGPWPTCHLQPCDAVRREQHHENPPAADQRTTPLQLASRPAALEDVANARGVDERAPDDVSKKGSA